jgi:hypothetical protein
MRCLHMVDIYICLSFHLFKLENRWTDFYEITIMPYAIRDLSNFSAFNFLQSAVTMWQTHKLAR